MNDVKENSNTKKALAKAILVSFKDMFSVGSEQLEKYDKNFDISKYSQYVDGGAAQVHDCFLDDSFMRASSSFDAQLTLKQIKRGDKDSPLRKYNEFIIKQNLKYTRETVYYLSKLFSLCKALRWISLCGDNNGRFCDLAKCLKVLMYATNFKNFLGSCKYFSTLKWNSSNFSKNFFHTLHHISTRIESLEPSSNLQKFYADCICFLAKRLFDDNFICKAYFCQDLVLHDRRWGLYKKGIWAELPYGCPYKIAAQDLFKLILRKKIMRSELAAEKKNKHDIQFALPIKLWNDIFKYLTLEEKLNALSEYLWNDSKNICPLEKQKSKEGKLIELILYLLRVPLANKVSGKFDSIASLIKKDNLTEENKLKLLTYCVDFFDKKAMGNEDIGHLLNYFFPNESTREFNLRKSNPKGEMTSDEYERFIKELIRSEYNRFLLKLREYYRLVKYFYPNIFDKTRADNGLTFACPNVGNRQVWSSFIKCLTKENKSRLLNYLFADVSDEAELENWVKIAALYFSGFDVKNFNEENKTAWIDVVEYLTEENKSRLLNYLFADVSNEVELEIWGKIAALCFPGFDLKNFNEENKAAWINVVKYLTEENKKKLLICLWPDKS